MYSMNTAKNLGYWMENLNLKVSGFSYHSGEWSWRSKTANLGVGHQNYKIQDNELRRAIKNAVHQFWDTNGAKTAWKVGDPDYKSSILSWAPNAGVVPKNAFKTGCKARNGTPMYVIKAKYKTLEIPGVWNPGQAFGKFTGRIFPTAFVSWGSKAHAVKDFEVLLNNNESLVWKPMKKRKVPSNAIVISKENGCSIYSVKGY